MILQRALTLGIAFLMVMPVATFSAEPGPNDFAEGITLTATGAQPLQELPLPEKVYATITQWTLADLRVFNSNGNVTPHAFCDVSPPTSSTEQIEVPVYSVDARKSQTTGRDITLHTADGSSLTIPSYHDASDANPLRANASYVLDLRKVDRDINGLWLDWSLPSGASETSVSVLSSNDLSHWQMIASNAKLLRATASDHTTLEQSSIPLPNGRYQYLRLEPAGDALIINSAKIEYHVVHEATSPTWYSAGPPHGSDDPHELRYENTHRVPVTLLRLVSHIENSSMHVTVQSRDRQDHAWQTQWTGEVFDVHFNDKVRRNDVIIIPATRALEWRLLFADEAEPPASAPSFELGYVPMHLRFLAQGAGPFTLAYGNARLTMQTAQPCDSLLSTISTADKQQLIGTPIVGAAQILAGKDVLVVKKQIPTRTLLLWGILLAGVAVIVKISLSLLKSSKQQNQD